MQYNKILPVINIIDKSQAYNAIYGRNKPIAMLSKRLSVINCGEIRMDVYKKLITDEI